MDRQSSQFTPNFIFFICRINHSCCPNVVWSWLKGAPASKEVRAITHIQPGQELCANYIDSFEVRHEHLRYFYSYL